LGQPRHAQVVPAFVAVTILRPLDCWLGAVRPADLLRWERIGDLPESARDHLRQVIVRRIRPRAAQLWGMRVGVQLSKGWEERVSVGDRKRVEGLRAVDQRPLQEWTLREVKEALHLPLERTLKLLATLEAGYWVPPQATTKRMHKPPARSDQSVELTDEMRELAGAVLSLPWTAKISPQDLRFGFAGDACFVDHLRRQLRQQEVPQQFVDLLHRLRDADRLTAAAEAYEITRSAARGCGRASWDDEAVERAATFVMRRHISSTGTGVTLAEVGEQFGVTRERVRQVCEPVEEVLGEGRMVSPALDRVLQAAARIAPAPVESVNEQLRRFIGDGASIESLIAWAAALGRRNLPVVCERVRTRVRGQLVEVVMIGASGAPHWVEPMIRHASRDMSMFGATNVLRVAGKLALKEGVAPGQEAIESALELLDGFRWLDKQAGWFTLGDSSGCSTASRVKKIMAVAQESVGADEIAGALASDDLLVYRESTSQGLATPPVHVLRELMLGWNWLKAVQKGRFLALPEVDLVGSLSDVELAIVEVIAGHGGIACRFELKAVVTQQLGHSDMLLSATLGSSPIIDRVEFGL